MYIYFSTVLRGAPAAQAGECVWLDWSTKQVLNKVPVYPRNPSLDDPNPRGGGRGARGIHLFDDKVMVASYHTLQVYDRTLRHRYDQTNGLFVGVHELFPAGQEAIWVSSTVIDAALKMNLTSGAIEQQHWPREMPNIQKALNITPLTIDKQEDNRLRYLDLSVVSHPSHLHLNALATWQGDLYGLLGFKGVIANLTQDEVVIHDPALEPRCHNLVIQENGTAITASSYGRTLHFYDLNTRQETRRLDLMKFAWVRKLAWPYDLFYQARQAFTRLTGHWSTPPRPLFLRGMVLRDDQLFISATPACIMQIDLAKEELVDAYVYSRKIGLGIHALGLTD